MTSCSLAGTRGAVLARLAALGVDDDEHDHLKSRKRLAALGTPWASLPARERYGTLVLCEDSRDAHVRLRVPHSPDEAHRLRLAVFEARALDEGLLGLEVL